MMFKKTRHYVLFITVLFITLIIMLSKIDIEKTKEIIKSSDWKFLLYGIGILLFCWCIEAFVIKRMLKRVGCEVGYFTALKLKSVGVFYAHITPFASGGQPAQMLKLRQDGINPSK